MAYLKPTWLVKKFSSIMARPDLVDPIVPPEGSRVATKVRHSAFYSTPVAYLLNRLGTKRLIL
jgi:nicotinamidase-related amidase